MLAQKVFLRKNRRGSVVKVVREHYLRDDIGCGVENCSACNQLDEEEDESTANRTVLEECPSTQGISHSLNGGRPHLVILDANVFLRQMDAIEAPVGFSNVVVLQTVLEEVKKRSSPVFKRIRDLLADRKRRFFLFVNEHCKDTYVERRQGESANDRNDRAIRAACTWYKKHLAGKVDAVLVTDDRENRRLALEEGLVSVSVKNYVQAIEERAPLLSEKLCANEGSDEITQSKEAKSGLFPEHLSPLEVNVGIKDKSLKQGVFYLSRTNFTEATIMCESLDKPVLVKGLRDQNRAVDGDHVAFQLFTKSEWQAPAPVVLDDDGEDPGDTLDVSDAALASSASAEDLQPTGRVVAIVKRKWRQYCGILMPSPVGGGISHLFVPAERKIPRIRIETRQAQKLTGQRIIVAVDSWPRHSRYPQGHFVRSLGPIGDKATENEVLLLEHDIPHTSFSEQVLDCLPSLPWSVSTDDERRVDCRHLDICSVDPPGCTDIDDALHCHVLPDGLLEVGVHIADVSYFVRPGTALDKEAANRSTTVYLTDRRIDMVPELLSSNLCSLRGGEERFAFSCIWTMTPNAEIRSTRFHKSIIRSRAAMTYEQAQNKIDDPEAKDSTAASLRRLLSLSKILKNRRMENGALVLASSEIRFDVDSETADPIDVKAKQVFETNSMVEEFMLLANISSAEKIFQEFPDCAMLRRHPAPPPSNFDPLVKAGQQQGFEIDVSSGKALADSLDLAVDPKNPYFNTMLRMITTRCMMQAIYFASGTIEEPLFHHYGLACPIYTHFTSPIRRYADVIVHRLLAAAIGCDATYPELLDKKKTQSIAENINYRHRMAQYASRASVNLHTHLFFKSKIRDEVGYVLFVRQNALQVLIPKYGLEGTLFLRSDLADVDFLFDEAVPSQTCKGVSLTLFQRIKIQISLDQSNVQHEKLVLRLVSPVIEGFSVAPVGDSEEQEPSKSATPNKRASEEKKDLPKKKTKRK